MTRDRRLLDSNSTYPGAPMIERQSTRFNDHVRTLNYWMIVLFSPILVTCRIRETHKNFDSTAGQDSDGLHDGRLTPKWNSEWLEARSRLDKSALLVWRRIEGWRFASSA